MMIVSMSKLQKSIIAIVCYYQNYENILDCLYKQRLTELFDKIKNWLMHFLKEKQVLG